MTIEILPSIGTNIISFGKSKEEAINILGSPDKEYTTDHGCKRIQFNTWKIELSFEPENNDLLGWIEVHHPNAILFGSELIGTNSDDALIFLNNKLNEEPEIEDYGSFLSVSYDTYWIELILAFGVVKNINLGVLYNQKDVPLWPSE